MTTTRIKPSNIDTTANYTFNRVTVSTGIAANGSLGSNTQVLTSDASGNNYWAPGFTTGKAIAMSIVFGG
jgi:hypothetical protein